MGWYAYETCENCSHTTYQERAKLGHSYTNYISNNDVTCTQDGTKTATCDNGCGKADTVTDKATGHNWVNGCCIKCGEQKISEGLEYTLNADGKAYSVSGIGTCTDTDLIIPAIYNDLTVTSIAEDAFRDCSNLTSVYIGDNITSIGGYAFNNCSSLTGVYITDIVAWCDISFGNAYANPLYYAEKLYVNNELVTELVIPDNVTSIGDWAFYNRASYSRQKIRLT